ncbi:MAG: hypothetical protein WBI20_13845 [Burkholderiaceae bacterium]
MSIAVLALGGPWSSILNLLRWLLPSAAPHPTLNRKTNATSYSPLQQSTLQALPTVNTIQTEAAARPLRVVQWIEAGQSFNQTGRLVISGRLADVCAELDRLVERESSRH